MHEVKVTFDYNARFFQLGNIDETTKEVWFVCHGQGQLASYFLKKFEPIQSTSRCIIAPEGLSKYYLNGLSGRVGASWMTKENRLVEIDNYINYLNQLYHQLIPSRSTIKVVLFGFSQGVATACRWANQSTIRLDRLILWAGTIPPDLDLNFAKTNYQKFSTTIAYGLNDEFIGGIELEEMKVRINQLGIDPHFEIFNGKHEINTEALRRIAE